MDPDRHEGIRRLARRYESEVDRNRADQLAARAIARANVARPLRRWVLVGVVTAGAVTVAGVAVGLVSDEAVPGQVWYQFDRAVESLARPSVFDRSEERLEEALVLIDRGRTLEATELIEEALAMLSQGPPLASDLVVPSATEPPETTPSQAPVAAGEPPAAEEPSEEDPAILLRLAAEFLLRTVQEVKAAEAGDGEDLEALALQLNDAQSQAEAVAQQVKGAATQGGEETVVPPTSSTVPVTSTTDAPASSTTSTTTPTTTTSVPSTTTTTTTIPDESGGDGSGGGDLGPIILPPQP